MTTVSRQVKFQGIDLVFEDLKTDKEAENVVKKMAEASRKQDIRFFLMFLQTYTNDERRGLIPRFMAEMLSDLFPDGETEDQRWESFHTLVDTLKLPWTDKPTIRNQTNVLEVILRVFENRQIYRELDRFLQWLRHTSEGNTLERFLMGLVDNADNASEEAIAEARGLAQQIREHLPWMRALNMTDAALTQLRRLMESFCGANAYEHRFSTPVSSDESSDEDEELATF